MTIKQNNVKYMLIFQKFTFKVQDESMNII